MSSYVLYGSVSLFPGKQKPENPGSITSYISLLTCSKSGPHPEIGALSGDHPADI